MIQIIKKRSQLPTYTVPLTVCCLATGLIASSRATATNPEDNAAATKAFGTASYLFVLAETPNGIESRTRNYVLREPSLVTIGGRWFVRGKPFKDAKRPGSGIATSVGVAWENVVEFSTFTGEQFDEFLSEKEAETN